MIESVIKGDEGVNENYKEETDFMGRGDKNYTRDTQFLSENFSIFKIQYSLKYTIFSCKELEKMNCRERKGLS